MLTFRPVGIRLAGMRIALALTLPPLRTLVLVGALGIVLFAAGCMAVRYRGFGIELDVEPVGYGATTNLQQMQ